SFLIFLTSFFATGSGLTSFSSFLQAIKVVNSNMKARYLKLDVLCGYYTFSPQFFNSSSLHNSGKNILLWYLGCIYFFQLLPPDPKRFQYIFLPYCSVPLPR